MQQAFSHWERIPGSPLELDSPANRVVSLRTDLGKAPSMPSVPTLFVDHQQVRAICERKGVKPPAALF